MTEKEETGEHYVCAKNTTLEKMEKTLEQFANNQKIILKWMRQQDERLVEGNRKFKKISENLKDRDYRNGHQDRDIMEEKERTLKIEKKFEEKITYIEKNYATKEDFQRIYEQNLNIGKNIYVVIGFMVTILIVFIGYSLTRII